MQFRSRQTVAYLTALAGLLLLPGSARAQTSDSLTGNLWDALRGRVPHETAVGLYTGTAYDWSNLYFSMASVQALYDYDDIWPHRAPNGLAIRFEASAGLATGTDFSGERFMASGNFLAVYELSAQSRSGFTPYVEGGVGLIYTDFQREGQGSRLNFNPVAGLGVRKGNTFIVLRAHHISNAGLHKDNRGINSVVLGFGVYF